ncbi:hypothetical protein ACFUAC_25080 [Streptomyces sp. NPDC057148]|uniref:hypothetical protein n=1 Tax=unclassified Streptomyces TaxID=2593676 RepID=UPI0036317E28
MSGTSAVAEEARNRRTRRPILMAVAIACYVLAIILGMFLLADDARTLTRFVLWVAGGLLLRALIRQLGARESSAGAALFIVLASVMCVYLATVARDDLTLRQRGDRTTATVVKERRDEPQGRKARNHHYWLEHQDGTRVPGPALKSTSDSFDVGQTIVVLEDPEGELRPQTPGQADPTGDLLGSGALALAALCGVGWMTWRGSDTAKQRDEGKPSAGMRKVYKAVTRNHTTHREQEEKLRDALRNYPADRRGYIKVHPEKYPDISQQRAARIAWEEGLRAEAIGNRGSWRFGETVIEEVPRE